MKNSRNPLLIGVVVLVVLAGVLYLVSSPGSGGDSDTGGAMFSSADRDALNAPPVARGATPNGADPGVDLNDPAAVATAYVVAGYGLRDTDAGTTNRRAVPYAAPATPPSEVGVLVVNPPLAGHRVVVSVTDVRQVAGEPTDTRRGYVVGYRAALDPPGPPDPERRTRYLLLVRQIDGHWLVAADRPDAQVGEL